MFAFLVMSAATAFGASDSVAVFQRPEKIVVQINESGSNSRLQKFMNAWGAGEQLFWQTASEDVRINCGRGDYGTTCMFRLIPSEIVRVEDTVASAELPLTEVNAGDIEVGFESSRGQKFALTIADRILKIKADSSRTATK